MGQRYTYTTNLEFSSGDDCGPDHDVTVSFVINDNLIDDITLEKVDGKPRPWGMYDGWVANEDDQFANDVADRLENSDRHFEAMMIEAAETDAAALDHRDEMRAGS